MQMQFEIIVRSMPHLLNLTHSLAKLLNRFLEGEKTGEAMWTCPATQ